MAKKKKSKKPIRAAIAAPESRPNMFERLGSKKRFDVLGKKVKGEIRNMGSLRASASTKRKNTLLVEYRQLRKNNAFIDRRFGEEDETLTEDERALMRFQKQRMRELATSKFTLGDDEDGIQQAFADNITLTHLGRSLADDEDALTGGWATLDNNDDDDDDLDRHITQDLHFGGGFIKKQSNDTSRKSHQEPDRDGDDQDGPGNNKSRKEVMEEIIAKSKMHKAIKAQQKDEDLRAIEALDEQWKSLSRAPFLASMLKPKGSKHEKQPKDEVNGAEYEDKRFDVLTKELIFEAKAQPGERTLTAEELEELERHRLEELEKERLKRQQGMDDDGNNNGIDRTRRLDTNNDGGGGGDDDHDDFDEYFTTKSINNDDKSIPAGGYAARRAKRARREAERGARHARQGNAESDDDDDDDDGDGDDSSDSDDGGGGGLTALEIRRRERAAGDHPLQAAFREAAAKLLNKHGITQKVGEEEEKDEDDDDDDDAAADDAAAAAAADDDDDDDELDIDSKEEEEEDAEAEADHYKKNYHHTNAQRDAKDTNTTSKQHEPRNRPSSTTAPIHQQGLLTFTPSLPTSYAMFASMAQGLSPADLHELVSRIRGYNAAALATENKKAMQMLFGCLIQHVMTLAEPPLAAHATTTTTSSSSSHEGNVLGYINALVPHAMDICQQVPLYAATLSRARLTKAHEEMLRKLRDPLSRADAWPSAKTTVFLKLIAMMFPATDKRHPVLTPASLFIQSALALCPITQARQVAVGLFLSSLSVHMHSRAHRFVPEALHFAVRALRMAGTKQNDSENKKKRRDDDATSPSSNNVDEEFPWLSLEHGVNDDDDDDDNGTAAYYHINGDTNGPVNDATLSFSKVFFGSSWSSLPSSEKNTKKSSKAGMDSGYGHKLDDELDDDENSNGDYFATSEFKIAAVAAAINVIKHIATTVLKDVDALPEIMQPGAMALQGIIALASSDGSEKRKRGSLASHGSLHGATVSIASLAEHALNDIEQAVAAVRSARRPLVNRQLTSLTEVKQFNPRYEESFVAGKDYDPDRERAERKRLQRQVRKEERGAMRELRKDSLFMAEVRDREKTASQAQLDASAKRAMSFLEQQEADFKSGGQGGMWKKKKK